ncbi:MAG: flavin reductase family protein [Burkholderiaceae bacterium]
MQIDFTTLTAQQCYKLMVNLVVPRPVALVTTLSPGGVVNAAPFSVFNMVGEDPPLVMVSINKLPGGAFKDTARNILAQREFVVHIADEATAIAMDATAAELPADVSEIDVAGFTVAPCIDVKPPRIVEVPVAFECTLHEIMESESRFVFFGRILRLHAREGLVDTETMHVDLHAFAPVGRFGAGQYVRLRDRFLVVDGQCVAPPG